LVAAGKHVNDIRAIVKQPPIRTIEGLLETMFSVGSSPRQYRENARSAEESENVRGLNLAVVKLTTVQVTKLPLQHKIRKIGMICFAKPVLTDDLYIVQKKKF
jgi:hypothetical protein